MTTHQNAREDQDSGTAPVACSLTLAGLAAQAGRWQQLAAKAMTERVETARGLRLRFRPVPGAEEELRQLVAVETECCRWATWTVQNNGGHLLLDIHSTGDGIAALHSMFTGLHPAPAAAHG